MMATDQWESVIRRPALDALKTLDTPEARQLVQQFTPPGQ
jgi:hypothetical protein